MADVDHNTCTAVLRHAFPYSGAWMTKIELSQSILRFDMTPLKAAGWTSQSPFDFHSNSSKTAHFAALVLVLSTFTVLLYAAEFTYYTHKGYGACGTHLEASG